MSCLLVSSCWAAPQTLFARQGAAVASHTSQNVRSPFGSVSSHSKTVTDLDGSAHVHRFDSRAQNNVVRVARPRLVTSGPFAVQAFPQQQQVIVGGNGATPVITAARGVSASSNLFQTPDGRIFAFSNGNDQILPGQIFQTPDGRIFTTAVVNNNNAQSQAQAQAQSNESVIQAVRDAAAQPAQEEEEEEVAEIVETEQVQETNQRNQQQQQQQQQRGQEVVVTQGQNGLPFFQAVPQTVLARAPFTPATQRFVAAPAQVAHAEHVVAHDEAHHVVAAPTLVRTQAAPAIVRAAAPTFVNTAQFNTPVFTPVTNPDGSIVSNGFFHFPGAGFAFDF